jgi:hypothetical protein
MVMPMTGVKSQKSEIFANQASNFLSSRVRVRKISRERLAGIRLPSPPTDHQKSRKSFGGKSRSSPMASNNHTDRRFLHNPPSHQPSTSIVS